MWVLGESHSAVVGTGIEGLTSSHLVMLASELSQIVELREALTSRGYLVRVVAPHIPAVSGPWQPVNDLPFYGMSSYDAAISLGGSLIRNSGPADGYWTEILRSILSASVVLARKGMSVEHGETLAGALDIAQMFVRRPDDVIAMFPVDAWVRDNLSSFATRIKSDPDFAGRAKFEFSSRLAPWLAPEVFHAMSQSTEWTWLSVLQSARPSAVLVLGNKEHASLYAPLWTGFVATVDNRAWDRVRPVVLVVDGDDALASMPSAVHMSGELQRSGVSIILSSNSVDAARSVLSDIEFEMVCNGLASFVGTSNLDAESAALASCGFRRKAAGCDKLSQSFRRLAAEEVGVRLSGHQAATLRRLAVIPQS